MKAKRVWQRGPHSKMMRRRSLKASYATCKVAARRLARRPPVTPPARGTSLEWCVSLPNDLSALYPLLPPFINEATRDPVPMPSRYQSEVWDDIMHNRHCVYPKSTKIGLTDLLFIFMIWRALKTDRGSTMYIVDATRTASQICLDYFMTYIEKSPILRNYLVIKPLRDKAGRLIEDSWSRPDLAVIYNPENPERPTRIYARSILTDNELIPHENVSHIHFTNISASKVPHAKTRRILDVIEGFLKTDVSMVIESPTLERNGSMERICFGLLDKARKDGAKLDDIDGEFCRDGRAYRYDGWLLRRLGCDVGMRDGIQPQESIQMMRETSDAKNFDRLYEARLNAGIGGSSALAGLPGTGGSFGLADAQLSHLVQPSIEREIMGRLATGWAETFIDRLIEYARQADMCFVGAKIYARLFGLATLRRLLAQAARRASLSRASALRAALTT